MVNEELAKRLAKDGHEVTFLVGGYSGAKQEEMRDGYRIIRLGNRVSLYWKAFLYYKKHLQGKHDLVIEEINTIPFFTKFYVKEKNILFVHQLAREIWFYQMFFPLSLVGYLLEPLYLRLLSTFNFKLLPTTVITISESSKQDLVRHGFNPNAIHIISMGLTISILENLSNIDKFDKPTLLSIGAIRSMKRTHHIIKAFEIAKKSIPELQLIVAGIAEGTYGKKALSFMKSSSYTDSISYVGRVNQEKKTELMQKSHILLVTSVKEGWGLVVTEAASQGMPAIVYNVDGLRDSVRHNHTGLITTANTSLSLSETIVFLFSDPALYRTLRINAWEWSKEITFDRCYRDFINIIKN